MLASAILSNPPSPPVRVPFALGADASFPPSIHSFTSRTFQKPHNLLRFIYPTDSASDDDDDDDRVFVRERVEPHYKHTSWTLL